MVERNSFSITKFKRDFHFFFHFSVGIQYLEAIRRLKELNFQPNRTIHCLFVPDEEIGGMRGMNDLLKLDAFKALNVGFVFDEGQ